MDQEEIKLKKQYLEAHIKYINAVRKRYQENFTKKLNESGKKHFKYDTHGFTVSENNKTDTNDLSEKEQSELKTIYRALAIKYHPDKNKTSEELFVKINEYYQANNISALRTLSECLDREDIESIDQIAYMECLEKEIKGITGTVYWQWNKAEADMKKYYESMFMTDDEHRIFLESEHDKLRDENERLKDLIKSIKSYGRVDS